MVEYCGPGLELRRLAWPTQARTSLDFVVACVGDTGGAAAMATATAPVAPLPPMPAELTEAGFSRGIGKGTCLSNLIPERCEAFSRPARLQAGDLALFVADPDMRIMGKFFIGARPGVDGGREFLFYASALRLVIAVPEPMLRHVERTEFIRTPGGMPKAAPNCQAAQRLAATLGCEPDAEGIVVPAMASAREAARAVGREIARRSQAFPERDPQDDLVDLAEAA